MKTVKTFLLALAISFTSIVSADTKPPKTMLYSVDDAAFIQKHVTELLKDPYFKVEKDMEAYVRLIVSENDELVVLSVESKQKDVVKFIKSRINYKTIPEGCSHKYKQYKFPVKIRSGN